MARLRRNIEIHEDMGWHSGVDLVGWREWHGAYKPGSRKHSMAAGCRYAAMRMSSGGRPLKGEQRFTVVSNVPNEPRQRYIWWDGDPVGVVELFLVDEDEVCYRVTDGR